MKYTPEDVERFWKNVNKDGVLVSGMLSRCWEWTRCLTRGYGTFHPRRSKGSILAHRFSWHLHTGRILSSEEFVCHKCDNRRCVNPEHLFQGDAMANVMDMIVKGRGHHRLTRDQVMEIFNSRETGRSWTFAKKFSVSKSEVRAIWFGRSWSWLTGKTMNPTVGLTLKEQR